MTRDEFARVLVRLAALGILLAVLLACSAQASLLPSSSPTPAVASPSPAPSVGGSPTPDPGLARITRFLDRIRDADVAYRVAQTYELRLGDQRSTTTTHTDVSGADTYSTSDTTSGDETLHEEIATVGGRIYELGSDGEWTIAGQQDTSNLPFQFLDAGNLSDHGRGLHGGQLLSHLGLIDPVPLSSAVAEDLGVSGGSAQIVGFDVFAASDGRPVFIELTFSVMSSAGDTVGIGTIEQTYTDFDAEIVVTAPPIG